MDLNRFAKAEFRRRIMQMDFTQINPILKQKLLRGDHPRVNRFLENVAKEITEVNKTRIRKGKQAASKENLQWLVGTLTDAFVYSVETEVRLQTEAESERLKRQRAAQEVADMEATLAGKPQGIYEEMGIVFDEKALGPERDQEIKEDTPKGR